MQVAEYSGRQLLYYTQILLLHYRWFRDGTTNVTHATRIELDAERSDGAPYRCVNSVRGCKILLPGMHENVNGT